jgi:hypothetical protein
MIALPVRIATSTKRWYSSPPKKTFNAVTFGGLPMGRTLPPFSQLIDAERRRWAPFKRALPKADQALVDRLFDCAKIHIQAGVMVSRPWPFETMVMAVLLEHEKRIETLHREIEALTMVHTNRSLEDTKRIE